MKESSYFEANVNEDSEIYENSFGGFIVSSNLNREWAMWYQDGYEALIQGGISREWMIRMLDSIKK